MVTLGTRLRALREEKGLTLEQVAKKRGKKVEDIL